MANKIRLACTAAALAPLALLAACGTLARPKTVAPAAPSGPPQDAAVAPVVITSSMSSTSRPSSLARRFG